MSKIRIETHFDEQFGMYAAVSPEHHYCTGLGKTPEQARARLEFAISLWFGPEGGRLRGRDTEEHEVGQGLDGL